MCKTKIIKDHTRDHPPNSVGSQGNLQNADLIPAHIRKSAK